MKKEFKQGDLVCEDNNFWVYFLNKYSFVLKLKRPFGIDNFYSISQNRTEEYRSGRNYEYILTKDFLTKISMKKRRDFNIKETLKERVGVNRNLLSDLIYQRISIEVIPDIAQKVLSAKPL